MMADISSWLCCNKNACAAIEDGSIGRFDRGRRTYTASVTTVRTANAACAIRTLVVRATS
jgi:hypothetical protein